MTSFGAFLEPLTLELKADFDIVHFSKCPCPSSLFGSRSRDPRFLDVVGLSNAVSSYLGLPDILAPTLIGIEKIRYTFHYFNMPKLNCSFNEESKLLEAIRVDDAPFNNRPVLVICYDEGISFNFSSMYQDHFHWGIHRCLTDDVEAQVFASPCVIVFQGQWTTHFNRPIM